MSGSALVDLCSTAKRITDAAMRRLAKQQRKDDYSSKRDYQTVTEKLGVVLLPSSSGKQKILLRKKLVDSVPSQIVGFGGYFAADESVELRVSLSVGTVASSLPLPLDAQRWRRFGMVIEAADSDCVDVLLEWDTKTPIHMWGVNVGRLHLTDAITTHTEYSTAKIGSSHLVPETFYLDHDKPLDLEPVAEECSQFALKPGRTVSLKKCSYDGRWLPLDPKHLGSLAFHKHKSKKTHHQNECRACKKWRINNQLNMLRTADQFHESSSLNRERKLFLHESEILQRIKKRDGAGLKSIIWEKFGKKCFMCEQDLTLREVQLDHTRPLAYLWPIDEHATCLCAVHNNEKREKFPFEYYPEAKLKALSELCGLTIDALKKRDVNERELKLIMADLVTFAKTWEPRTFQATARRIKEVRPNVDLFDLLKVKDPELHNYIVTEIAKRPPAVVADEDYD